MSLSHRLPVLLELPGGLVIASKPSGVPTQDNEDNPLRILCTDSSEALALSPLGKSVPGPILGLRDPSPTYPDPEVRVQISRGYQCLVAVPSATESQLPSIPQGWDAVATAPSVLCGRVAILECWDWGSVQIVGTSNKRTAIQEYVSALPDCDLLRLTVEDGQQKRFRVSNMRDLPIGGDCSPEHNEGREKWWCRQLSGAGFAVIGKGQHRRKLRGVNGCMFVSSGIRLDFFQENSHLGAVQVFEEFPRLFKVLENERVRWERRQLNHVIGETRMFGGFEFFVGDGDTPDVMCPKAGSETLVQAAVQMIRADESWTVIDLGVGSGCLLLSILAQCSTARVHGLHGWGFDISAQALQVANLNATRMGLSGMVHLVQSSFDQWIDCMSWERSTTQYMQHMLIVCNPPYLTESDYRATVGDCSNDPKLAMIGNGEHGLDAYRSVAATAQQLVREVGWMKLDAIILEVPARKSKLVTQLMRAKGFQLDSVHKDVYGLDRAAVFTLIDHEHPMTCEIVDSNMEAKRTKLR